MYYIELHESKFESGGDATHDARVHLVFSHMLVINDHLRYIGHDDSPHKVEMHKQTIFNMLGDIEAIVASMH